MYQLDSEIWFPDPYKYHPKSEIVAVGGDLSAQRLILAYSLGSFEEVMRNCANISRRGQDGTWISEEMIKAYTELNQQGKAKSIEVWENGELVGGFYGVEMGHVFCGESMFSKVSNASKAGFIQFVEKNADRYQLIDCQVYTEHLESLGAREIPKIEFLDILRKPTN